MTTQQYKLLYPEEYVWMQDHYENKPWTIQIGMLQFDDSACYFAGPFDGNFCFFSLTNQKQYCEIQNAKAKKPFLTLKSKLELQTKHYLNGCKNEEHLQKTLRKLSQKDRKKWENRKLEITEATSDAYFTLKLHGNDDASYSKFYTTKENALEELNLLLEIQPCNMEKDILSNQFVFTN